MKRTLSISLLCICLLCGLYVFFRPLQLSKCFDESKNICVSELEFEIIDGEPYIKSDTYNDITIEQKEEIEDLFQKYSYRRTLRTPFSDGSMSDLGDIVVHIYIYEDKNLITSISVSNENGISINQKNYKLSNSSEFIFELINIISL